MPSFLAAAQIFGAFGPGSGLWLTLLAMLTSWLAPGLSYLVLFRPLLRR